MKPDEYNFPVWATQGGGLVREVGGVCVFVEAPSEGMGLTVGDEMPREWDTIPSNKLALELDFEGEVDALDLGELLPPLYPGGSHLRAH